MADDRCVNCGWCKMIMGSTISALPSKCQDILKHWTKIEDLSQYKLCRYCYDIINKYSDWTESNFPERKKVIKEICIGCGYALNKRKRSSKLSQELWPYAIKYWPWYTILKESLQIKQKCCYVCFNRLKALIDANELTATNKQVTTSNTAITKIKTDLKNHKQRESDHETEEKFNARNHMQKIVENLDVEIPRINVESEIVLNDGMRLTLSTSKCFIKGCTSTSTGSRKLVPKPRRKMLTTYCNTFLYTNRVCTNHITFDSFDYDNVSNNFRNTTQAFDVWKFEKFVDDLKEGRALIDFENVEAMADHVCEYWTGHKVSQFMQMYTDLKRPKIMKSALAAYLIRKITGDSVKKLAKLFNINSVALKKQTLIVEKYFRKKEN